MGLGSRALKHCGIWLYEGSRGIMLAFWHIIYNGHVRITPE